MKHKNYYARFESTKRDISAALTNARLTFITAVYLFVILIVCDLIASSLVSFNDVIAKSLE